MCVDDVLCTNDLLSQQRRTSNPPHWPPAGATQVDPPSLSRPDRSNATNATYSTVYKWRSVGLPCGQFHGWSSVASRRTIAAISRRERGSPTITAPLHALDANMAAMREGRQGWRGSSRNIVTISCTSATSAPPPAQRTPGPEDGVARQRDGGELHALSRGGVFVDAKKEPVF
jgi:hypothetical protein